MRKLFVLGFSLQILLSGCALRIGQMSPNERSEQLAIEKGRLTELTDPVERTRSHIKISQFLMEFLGESVRDHDVEDMRPLVEEFTRAIQAARDTITQSGRDAERRPQGYKDLELSLRNQTRRLQDLRPLLTVDDRELLDRAIDLAAAIREEMLSLLFPLGVSRPSPNG